MRRLLLVLSLAACDRVFGLDDRTEEPADGAPGGDAPPTDEAVSSGCTFAEPSQSGVAAGDWFPDAALMQAVRTNSQGFVQLGHTAGKTVEMFVEIDYKSAFIMLPSGYSAMEYPSLSADSTLLVGRLAADDNVTFKLATARRASTIFQPPAAVDLRRMNGAPWNLDVVDVPSGPTMSEPRRMIISRSTGITEVVEDAAGWRAESETLASSLGLANITYATLASDGLALVLVGSTTANPSAQKVLRATRVDLGTPFGAASELFRPSGVGVSSAYLTADCATLFFVQQRELRWIMR